MFCPKCGTKNQDDAKFCQDCGNSLSIKEPTKSSSFDDDKSSEQKAEELKQKLAESSKETLSIFYYFIKPLLKKKIIIPLIVLPVFYFATTTAIDMYDKHKQQVAEQIAKEKQQLAERLAKEKRAKELAEYNKPIKYINGLYWQDTSDVESVEKSWSGAKNYCKYLNLGGKNSWRLPTIEELESIVDYTRYNPAIDKRFKHIKSSRYWSSTTTASDSSYAWTVYFKYGYDVWGSKSNTFLVRCVSPR